MILHLMYDEKVVDGIIDNFEYAHPNGNLFFIYKEDQNIDFVNVRNKDKTRLFKNSKGYINEVLAQFEAVEIIMCHGLAIEFARIILEINKPVKVVWVVIGYDLYMLPAVRKNIYAPETLKYVKQGDFKRFLGWQLTINPVIRKLYYNLYRKPDPVLIMEAAQKKADLFTTYIKEDFDLYKSVYQNDHTKFLYSAFTNIEQYVSRNLLNETIRGTNILLGNSNTKESNHIDVFEFLSGKISSDTKVYTTLSYGADEKYKQYVIKQGQLKLKDSFVPLLDFLSLEAYMTILLSCSVGIFYHYRQQAMGNIIAMLWLGARVYMSAQNPAFRYLKRIGMIVFDLDADFDIYNNGALSDEEIVQNKTILTQHFSKEKVAENYDNLIKEIYNKV